jgi:hypothetical protein
VTTLRTEYLYVNGTQVVPITDVTGTAGETEVTTPSPGVRNVGLPNTWSPTFSGGATITTPSFTVAAENEVFINVVDSTTGDTWFGLYTPTTSPYGMNMAFISILGGTHWAVGNDAAGTYMYMPLQAAAPSVAPSTVGPAAAATRLDSTNNRFWFYSNAAWRSPIMGVTGTGVSCNAAGVCSIPSSSGVTSVSGTTNQICSTGGTTPVLSLCDSIVKVLPSASLHFFSIETDNNAANIYADTNGDVTIQGNGLVQVGQGSTFTWWSGDLINFVDLGQQFTIRFGVTDRFVCTNTGCNIVGNSQINGNLQVVGTANPAALKTPQAQVVGSISYGTTATFLALGAGACNTGGSPSATVDGTGEAFDLSVVTGAGGCSSADIVTVELTNLITAWTVPKGGCSVTQKNNQGYTAGFGGLYAYIDFSGAEYILHVGVIGGNLNSGGVTYEYFIQCRSYDTSITIDYIPPLPKTTIQEKTLLQRMANLEKMFALHDKQLNEDRWNIY